MDLFIIVLQCLFLIFFLPVVMASGNVSAGSNVPEISAYRQTEKSDSDSPPQHNNVQDGEHHGYSALSLSIDSGTSSAELSQLHPDAESRSA